MTSTVIIKAHCASTKAVRVSISNGAEPVEDFLVQDGETAERAAYDERIITVREVLKAADKPATDG